MLPEDYKKLVRLYIPEPELAKGKKCLLSDGQAHYLRHVMRKVPGDRLRVFNGRDGEWLATVNELNKKNVLIEINEKLHEQQRNSDVWVFASPVKKEAFDLMVEKACELGAARFFPVICDHTVVHKVNHDRLQAIAIEAAEQSERLDVMSIESISSIKNALLSIDSQRNLIFCIERSMAPPLPDVVRQLTGKSLGILIGPEGGFSSQEIDCIETIDGVYSVSLGVRILRAETALISALACVQLLR